MKYKKTILSARPTRSSIQVTPSSARHYHSYLLRIWREDDVTPWRIQLEDPQTHEVFGFQSMEKLMRFLDEKAPVLKGGATKNNTI